jgi:hypothetical protein
VSKTLTCPRGHQWQAESDAADAQAGPCPVCGAAIESPTGPAPEGPLAGSEAPTVAKPADAPPEVPGYEILGVLGRGGMGLVYRARQSRLDRLVALKVLPAEAAKDPAFAERFTREARALARLNHPHIVTLYDFGQAGPLPYFVMEYVDGTSLRERLRQGPLPPAEAVRLAVQVCNALEEARGEGLVHRDIKPENVLLDKRGRVKVADFGVAKLLQRKEGEFTLTGPWQVMGTFHYMAPEQLADPLRVDHRADIWSLGVVLYEMLTGERPVGRFPLPSATPGVDARLDAIVLRALERDPERRFARAEDMAKELEVLAAPGSSRPSTGGRNPNVAAEERSTRIGVPVAGNVDGLPPRSRARKPGQALMVGGILQAIFTVSVWMIWAAALPDSMKFQSFEAMMLLVWAIALASTSSLMLLGGRQMTRRASHGWAVAGCWAALVPISPLWFYNAVVGALSLSDLRRPAVKRAFHGLGGRAGMEMALCGLGLFWSGCAYFGPARTWVPAVAFACLLLFLLITGWIEPAPVWRSGVVAVAGTGIALFIVRFFDSLPGPPLASRGPLYTYSSQWLVLVAGNCVAMGLAVGSAIMGCLELREALMRLHGESTPPTEPGSRAL